jgi:ribosome biogenesis GTPase
VVVLNKADLCGDVDAGLSSVRSIAGAADVIAISARESVDPLMQQLSPGATAILVGSSGAGKSTIANALTGSGLATQEVRDSDSRGRHTTTASLLIPVPGGAWLIDSPGLRELGLLASETSLDAGFPEIAELAAQCRFGDCLHRQEPGCAVRQALEEGRIPDHRWASYNKLRREVRHAALEADTNSQLAEKRKWKAIHKANQRMYRDRDRQP